MALTDLAAFLIAGGCLLWIGISGLRSLDVYRAKRRVREAQYAQENPKLPPLPEARGWMYRSWSWIAFQVAGGVTILGSIAAYFLLQLPWFPL